MHRKETWLLAKIQYPGLGLTTIQDPYSTEDPGHTTALNEHKF